MVHAMESGWKLIKAFAEPTFRIHYHLIYHLVFHLLLLHKFTGCQEAFLLVDLCKR